MDPMGIVNYRVRSLIAIQVMLTSAISSAGLTWQVVSRHGFSLKFASHNLRDDRQVVLAAVMTPEMRRNPLRNVFKSSTPRKQL